MAVHTAAVGTVERIAAGVAHTAVADVRTAAVVVDVIDPVVGNAIGYQEEAAGRQHHLAEAQRSSLVAYWDVVATGPVLSYAVLLPDDVARILGTRHVYIAAADRWFPIRDPFGTLPWWSAARTLLCL